MSKNMDEQLKLVHKMVDVVDRANKKICVILLWYNVYKPQSSYAQVRLFPRKKRDNKFQQIVWMMYKIEEFFCLHGVTFSV